MLREDLVSVEQELGRDAASSVSTITEIAVAQGRNTLMDPPIEDLLDKVDSKFTLVALGSATGPEVNSAYNSLGEGLGKVVPPQVASVSGKPVSIAFEEIAAGQGDLPRIDPEEEAALAGRPRPRARARRRC